MKELDLQEKYLIHFFTERADGLQYKEVKANTVSTKFFIVEDLKNFISETSLNKESYKKLLRTTFSSFGIICYIAYHHSTILISF